MLLLDYHVLLIKGTLLTLGAWLIASVLSLILGTVLGILKADQVGFGIGAKMIDLYLFIAKGVPAYVQILIAYFVLPAFFGLQIPAIVAAIGALVFCSSGYIAQIISAGINQIPVGQWQATRVLGYSLHQSLRRVILPQALRAVLPSLGGEFEQLLKSTALLSTIGITELTRTGMNIISRELNPVSVYLLIALIYLIFSFGLQLLLRYLQKKQAWGLYL